MNNFEKFVVELLQGNIKINDEIVEVRRSFLPSAKLPCITLSFDNDLIYEFRTHTAQEHHYAKYSGRIEINTWCNDETTRETINNQVRECFTKATDHHYQYCSNYNDGWCTTINNKCQVGTTRNARSVKDMCPYPDENRYQSLFIKHGLVDRTCILRPPFFSDEINEHPPILHSIFVMTADYVELLSSRGGLMEDLFYDDD